MALCFWSISNEYAIYGNTTRIVQCVICGISWFKIKNICTKCLPLYNTVFKKIVISIVAVIAAFGFSGSFYIKHEVTFYSLQFLRDFLITFVWNTPIVLCVSLVIINLSNKYHEGGGCTY